MAGGVSLQGPRVPAGCITHMPHARGSGTAGPSGRKVRQADLRELEGPWGPSDVEAAQATLGVLSLPGRWRSSPGLALVAHQVGPCGLLAVGLSLCGLSLTCFCFCFLFCLLGSLLSFSPCCPSPSLPSPALPCPLPSLPLLGVSVCCLSAGGSALPTQCLQRPTQPCPTQPPGPPRLPSTGCSPIVLFHPCPVV